MGQADQTCGRREVDPWRFTGDFLRKVLSARIPAEPSHGEIPWTPVSKPLSESKVALLSTAGLSMTGDEPFDMDGERERPTWGDPSWRRIRSDAASATVQANHLLREAGLKVGFHMMPGLPGSTPAGDLQMFRDLFYETLTMCKSAAPGKHKVGFKNKLLSLDSTTISLCLSLFP